MTRIRGVERGVVSARVVGRSPVKCQCFQQTEYFYQVTWLLKVDCHSL